MKINRFIRTSDGLSTIVEWNADSVLTQIRAMTSEQEERSAQRLLQRVKRRVPVRIKPYTPSVERASDWKGRKRGRLKASIRKLPSKFRDGGWLVWAGDRLAYYARFVEYGTIFMKKKSGERYMKKSLFEERNYFISELKRNLR